MRIFATKAFARFAAREKIDDDALRDAIAHVARGLIDANLGGGVVKQRVARHGKGKSGGYRTIILYRALHRAIFAYGFAKNDRENIEADELRAFRRLAGVMLNFSDGEIVKAVEAGALREIKNGQDVP